MKPKATSTESAFDQLAIRVSTHSAIYAASAATSVVAGLVGLVAFTRYLEPSDFGELAILLVSVSFLTLLYNLGSLQGTFAWAFGTAAGDEDALDDPDAAPVARNSRRALSTGFVLTACVAGAGTIVIVVLAPQLAGGLLSRPQDANLVIGAAVAAATAALLRLAANTLRLERRPVAFLAVTTAHHLLPVVLAIPLLAVGLGVGGAIVGLVAGTATALLTALVLIRGNLSLAASRSDALEIMRRGKALVPVVLAFQTLQLADVLLLSRFVPTSQVGLYRVATRIGALVSYWTSSFHMAWGPLRRDALHIAAESKDGRGTVAASMSTYFVVVTVGAILATAVFAQTLVHIAAPGYDGAADLIPLTASAYALHGLFVLVYRVAEFPGKRSWFVGCAVLSACVFALSTVVWIPLLGAAGAAIAVITGWTAGIAVLAWKSQRSEFAVPFEYAKAAGCLALAGVCLGVDRLAAPDGDAAQLAAGAAAMLVFAFGSAASGIVQIRLIRALLFAMLARVRPQRPRHRLSRRDHEMLDALLRRQMPPATFIGTSATPADAHRELVACLRRWGGVGTSQPGDVLLGSYLLSEGTFVDRDAEARKMYAEGVDPLEVDAVARAAREIRALSPRRWREQLADLEPDAMTRRRRPADGDAPPAS